MKIAGRVAAAIEILSEIFDRHRPASEALKDWAKAHRFAGSSDRHVIGTLVYDGLRNRLSAGEQAGGEDARAVVLGTLATVWKLSASEIETLCAEQFGPGPMTAQEKKSLGTELKNLPAHVEANYPAWLETSLKSVFGENLIEEMAALCQRAPIDLRVNTLKSDRPKLLEAFAKFGASETPLSPTALRIPPAGIDARNVNVEAEPAHGLGWFEVQDEASQIAVLLSGAKPGMRVLDLCAGAGGKTLALAALMKNEGIIIAHDRDKHRLRPIFERIGRSGATNIEVLPYDEGNKLSKVEPFDLVVADAPCTGSGTWRRKPDAKWRLQPKQLTIRSKEQVDVLDQAASLVKVGGTLAYFTCSLLPEENTKQIATFLSAHRDFKIMPYPAQWKETIGGKVPASADGRKETLLLSPASHNTDGFFVALMQRQR
jgi:16S rRNA (cytosine967-C5)-methyltransferase